MDSIIAIDENEMSRSTLCRKSWVFSGCSGFLPQGKSAGWVRINTVKNNAIVVIVKIKYTRKLIEKINNLFQVDIDRREQGCAAHYEQYCQHVVTALFNCKGGFPVLARSSSQLAASACI